jgi:molecular chaperone DnaJ
MATERDYYTVLGVGRDASDAEIKRAFRRLAQQWHPDVNTEAEADERFKEVNEAYQVLSDPQRRQAYDMFGRAGVSGDFGFGGGGQAGGGGGGFGGFGDIFDAFFGGAAAGARRGQPPAGADLRYDLRITFEEAVHGTDKEIEFPVLVRCPTCGGNGSAPGTEPVTCDQCGGRGEIQTVRQTMLGQMINVTTCPKCRGEGKLVTDPCPTCHGEGRVEERRTLRVTIPAGIDSGHQIRLSGEGEVGPRGGPAGSLYVAVQVAPHPQLRREGTELWYDADVSIAQAALGTRISVPTADGADEEVEIKAGTQPGTEVRLRGKGVPHLRRGSRGDLHVVVNVVVPTRLTKRQREILAEYADEAKETVSTNGSGILDKVRDALG